MKSTKTKSKDQITKAVKDSASKIHKKLMQLKKDLTQFDKLTKSFEKKSGKNIVSPKHKTHIKDIMKRC